MEPALDDAPPSGTELRIGTYDRLLHIDGTPAETIREVFEANAAPMAEGTFDRAAEFSEGRLIVTADGRRLAITDVRWTERVERSVQTIISEREGEPCLVMYALDEDGGVASGRIFVDRDLYGWEINEDGEVVQRGALPQSLRT